MQICKFDAHLRVGTKSSHRRGSLITTKVLKECEDMLANTAVDLGKRLRELDEKLEALPPRDLVLSDEVAPVQQQIQQEKDATLQGLSICAQIKTQVDENRSNVLSDIAMAEGGNHIVVTTIDDLISARRITAGANSLALIGQISDVDYAHHVSSHARDESSDSGSEQSSVSSVESLADGVFSIISGSSNSSVVGPTGAGERLVSLLLSDTQLSSLYQETLKRVSANKFERNFLRILNNFASELRKEAENPQQRSVAKLVRYRARNSAHIVRNALYSPDKPQEDIIPRFEVYHESIDKESDESEIGSGSDHEDDTDLQQLEDFILTSQAFIELRHKLTLFIYPTNEEKVVDKGKQLPVGRFASN